MSIAVCILAKDEARSIDRCLRQLAAQSFIREATGQIDIHVVANGCTDDTAEVASGCAGLFSNTRATLHVHDLQPGGKSRSWNRAVHKLTNASVDTFVFVDADISLTDDMVIAGLLATLARDHRLTACTGFPIKDVAVKANKTIIDRFSLIISKRTRHVGAINGSLYVARAKALRTIWLPDQTPGEDGFLNAMIATDGFTSAEDTSVIAAPDRPTHSFQAHGPMDFIGHERRMIVGTMINRWIFEHLWSLRLESPAGPMIKHWNETNPDWVERLIRQRAEKARWLIPNAILFYRFNGRGGRPFWKYAAYLPLAAVATLATVPPAVLANKRLKALGAASTW